MATTYAQQLTSVQDAIAKIEAGVQGYSLNGRTVSYADLNTLYQRESWLRKKVDDEANGGRRVRGVRFAR